jgi:glycosyltransferase involved in cell wall biosynthesis
MKLITVLIPALNGMPYLRETLDSLDVQTFRDFEVLLWDNGSTDGTVVEAQKWIPSRLPGRVVTGAPLPLHECLARMVEAAQTEFCARIDADDIALPDRFEKQAAYLQSHPDCAGVGGQMELINEQTETIGMADPAPTSYPGILFTLFWRNAMPHPAMMFRRHAVLATGNYCANQPVEDYDLWLRMCLCGQLANLPDVVLKYRVHDASVCAREKQAGTLIQKMHECAASHSLELFGIKEREMKDILARRKFCNLPALGHLLKSVSERSGISKATLCRLPEYRAAGRAVCHRTDLLTRIYLAVLETRAAGKSVTRMVVDKLNAK